MLGADGESVQARESVQAGEQVLADADGVRHRRQGWVHRPDAREEAGVHHVQVVQFVRLAVEVEHRRPLGPHHYGRTKSGAHCLSPGAGAGRRHRRYSVAVGPGTETAETARQTAQTDTAQEEPSWQQTRSTPWSSSARQAISPSWRPFPRWSGWSIAARLTCRWSAWRRAGGAWTSSGTTRSRR